MANIAQFQKRINKLSSQKAIELRVFIVIQESEKQFVEAQKLQLSSGRNNKGEIIGTYSQATEDIAANENPRQPKIAGEPFNFEYTGGLFDDMGLFAESDTELFFYSEDSKTDELVKQYSNLFGLTIGNFKSLMNKVVYPRFIAGIRKDLQL